MALVNSAFTVNVTPGAMPPVVHVSEYDVGRTYTVTINGENGSAFNIPTGTTATIEGTLNGSVGFTQSATISNNQVSFALSESMTAYSGKAWCKIKLTLNDEPIQTCAFVLAVDRAGVEADTVIGASGFEEQIREAVEDIVEGGGKSHAVLYTEQSLTDAQKTQARTNVGAGTYSKPSGGIPASDLASDVRTSLGKADTALQQHQSLSGYATETWVEGKGYQTAQDVQTAIAGKANSADVYTKTEVDQKLVGAMDYKGTKATTAELPQSGNATGDVWHITADGSEWAWNGSAWEELGTAVDFSGYATQRWVEDKGYLTLSDLPIYSGGVS